MGGLQALCFAIDVLLCPKAPKQAVSLAKRAFARGRDAVLQARREPKGSDGPARDALVDAPMFAALAREACGGLGVAITLSLALLDVAKATSCGLDVPLRAVLPRVTAALVAGSESLVPESPDADCSSNVCRAACIVLDVGNATGSQLCDYLLTLAEDIGVPLVDFVGVGLHDLKRAVETVLSGGLVTPVADPRFLSEGAHTQTVRAVVEQSFELWLIKRRG